MKRPFELVAEIQEKDAEIERLKAELKIEKRHWVEDDRDLHELCSLIIELCNAMERYHPTAQYHDLLGRAREAVR